MSPPEHPPEPLAAPGERTPEQREELKLRHFWRNLAANVLVESGWGFGMAVSSLYTVLPVFLRQLGAGARAIGLLPAISAVGFTALQLPTAYFAAPLHRKKYPFILAHIPACLCWLAVARITPALARWDATAAVAVFLALYGLYSLSVGPLIPMWSDFMNRLLPALRRGRAWGLITAAGSVGGMGGAVVVARVIGARPFPHDYALCFLLTFLAFSLGTAAFLWVREPISSRPRRREPPRQFVAGLRRALADSPDFRSFLIARSLMSFGGMAVGFYAVYAVGALKVPDSAVGVFTGVALAAQTVSNLFWGWVGDRQGYRAVAVGTGVVKLVAVLLPLLSPSYTSFIVVFALTGMAFAGEWLALLNLTIELCPEEDKTTYVSLASTLSAPAHAAAPLLGGFIAAAISYHFLFVAALVMQIVGLAVLILAVREPRARPPAFRSPLSRGLAGGGVTSRSLRSDDASPATPDPGPAPGLESGKRGDTVAGD